MLAYTYIKQGKFELIEKPKPELRDSRDAIVRVTLGSICTSDLHIKHGGVPRAEILRLIEMGKIDTTPLITHRFPLDQIETAYRIFENRQDGVIKVAVTMEAGM
jgi:threonine dehydrogenase-like Zn-dependent dehydrogenase